MNASRKHSWSWLLPESVFIGCPETSVKVTRTRCVIHCLPHITHNNAVLIYFTADASRCVIRFWPVPVTARSKAQVYGRSPAGIVGSNPTVGIDVRLLWVLCVVVRQRSLRRADLRVLPSVVCRWVWSRNLMNEESHPINVIELK